MTRLGAAILAFSIGAAASGGCSCGRSRALDAGLPSDARDLTADLAADEPGAPDAADTRDACCDAAPDAPALDVVDVATEGPAVTDLFTNPHRYGDLDAWRREAVQLHARGPIHRIEEPGIVEFPR